MKKKNGFVEEQRKNTMSCLRQWISVFDPDWAMFCPARTKTLFYLPPTNRPSFWKEEREDRDHELSADLKKRQRDEENLTHAPVTPGIVERRRNFEMMVRSLCSPNVLLFDPNHNSCTLTSFQKEKLTLTMGVSVIDVNQKFVAIHHIPFSSFDEHILILFPQKHCDQIFDISTIKHFPAQTRSNSHAGNRCLKEEASTEEIDSAKYISK